MRYQGTGAVEGLAVGEMVVFRHRAVPRAEPGAPAGADPALEMERFAQGRARAAEDYARLAVQMAGQFGADKAGILEGYIEILNDGEIEAAVRDRVGQGVRADAAALATFTDLAAEFAQMNGEYMCERSTDMADLGRHLAAAIRGDAGDRPPSLEHPCILVVDDLCVAETIQMNLSCVLGLAVDQGGAASHVSILARSLGIPCVVGLGSFSARAQDGRMCALDGATGLVLLDPDAASIAEFRRGITRIEDERVRLHASAHLPAMTRAGLRIPVRANIGSAQEAVAARRNGADGVGLFRTEFLYLDEACLPSEETQYLAYRSSLEALEGAPLVIRSLDIGGDKAFPALGLEKEDNPFLGYRAIRIGLERPDLLKPQLRAVLRAAAHGPVELMFPMVISLEELRRLKAILAECRRELEAEGQACASTLPVGVMVETPAAALMALELGAEADFFSIGTNDLTQYTLAVDRGNARIASRYDPLHPAVLRLIKSTCSAARQNGIPVCVCGEFAADERATALLIGLGVSELSVAPARVPAVKDAIRRLDPEACLDLAQRALALATVTEIRALLS